MWRYRYFGDWDNLRLYGPSQGNGNEEGSGAYHGTEIEMVLGVAEDVSGVPIVTKGKAGKQGRQEEKMMRVMMGAWAAFAGDSRHGLEEYGWPVYDPHTESLVRLGFDNKGKATFVRPEVYDDVCFNVTIEGKRR